MTDEVFPPLPKPFLSIDVGWISEIQKILERRGGMAVAVPTGY
jgi:hypothetical protein